MNKTELLNQSTLFDKNYYSKTYGIPEDKAIEDYLYVGATFGRNPSLNFNTWEYYENNIEVLQSGINPLVHYLSHGIKENRSTYPVQENEYNYNLLDLSDQITDKKIGIFLHLFHYDFLEKVIPYLKELQFEFELYIALPGPVLGENDKIRLNGLPNITKLEVRHVKNRGRNFGPLLVEFKDVLTSVDFLCHIHSKKSFHMAGAQYGWADFLLESLIGKNNSASHIAHFLASEDIALIYPERYVSVPFWASHWLQNHVIGNKLLSEFGFSYKAGFFDYPIGGMFWCRPPDFDEFFSRNWSYDEFPEETGQTDGTLQHAIERVIGLWPGFKGKKQLVFSLRNNAYATTAFNSLKKKLSSITPNNVISLCRQKKIVSFDIFDTLVKRSCINPHEAQRCVANTLNIEHEEYFYHRNNVEHKLRKTLKRDCKLSEIWIELINTLKLDESFNYYMEMELSYDLGLLQRRDSVSYIVKKLKHFDIKIIYVTDMYYETEQVNKILSHCGVEKPDVLYLSSDIGLRKDSGEIWPYIIKNEKINANDIVHIGDNIVSDVQIPTSFGISNIPLLSPIEKIRFMTGNSFFDTETRELEHHDSLLLGRYASFFGDNPFF